MVWHLIGDFFTIRQVGYQGHVIPVVIAVWLMCKIEKWLHKHVPEMIDLFVTPLCTVMITAFLTLGIIGPIFSTAEGYVLTFAKWIITVGYGVGAMIMGGLYPVTVVAGIHHMYNVIEAGMLSEAGGLNTWMPIASAANFAQCAACLAVGLKAKNAKTKAVAIPSSLSAALGITEPAIFGVNLRFTKPLLCGIAGGAVGAMLGSIMHIGATAYGVTGIPGYLTTLDYPLQYTIVLAVSFIIAFSLTWIFWKEEDAAKETVKKEEDKEEKKAQENTQSILENTNGNTIYAPLAGNVIALEQIPDDTFASGVLGNGVGIEPEEGEVTAPFDGTIATLTDTRHAIGLMGPNGMEMLIHVGIDTVNMKGEGFELYVCEGDTVKAGQKLMSFSIDKIKESGYSTTTAVLLNNSDDYENFQVVKMGSVKKGEPVITI